MKQPHPVTQGTKQPFKSAFLKMPLKSNPGTFFVAVSMDFPLCFFTWRTPESSEAVIT